MPVILHILDQLSGAGPTRSLIALAKYQARLGYAYQHRVATLQREAYPMALIDAKRAGLEILRAPAPAALADAIAGADIVQLSFWNNPNIYAFLRQNWPEMRLLLWFTISGDRAPQVISPKLAHFADCCVATSPGTLDLPALHGAARRELVDAPTDFDRFASVRPQPHTGFNVGYVGTVNFGKMHPEFVAMSAAVDVPGVRFILCGGRGEVQEQAVQSGAGARFEFRGFVENVGAVLNILDVFGYPLCEDTYATSEKSLQEARFVGIPPVVFPHGGVQYLVQDGETGLVVRTPAEYTQAVEYLYRRPDERARMGANARSFVQAHFAPDTTARRFDDIYRELLAQPKRARAWGAGGESPAQQFAEALGPAAGDFVTSMSATDLEICRAADARIAAASPLLSGGEGGIIHYRNTFPQDGWLRYWAGLVLLARKRHAEAANELRAALQLGLAPARVAHAWHQAEKAADV